MRLGIRLLIGTLLILALAEAAYVGGTYVFLRSAFFRQLLNADDGSVKVAFQSAWSYVPGQVVARDLAISGERSGVSWQLKADHARIHIDLLELRREIVAIHLGRGTGVDFGIRLDSTLIGKEETAKARGEREREEAAEETNDWAFLLHGLELVEVRELTLNDQRVAGNITVHADVEIARDGKLALPRAGARFDGAEIADKKARLAHIDKAEIALTLPPMATEADTAELVRALEIKLDFDAILASDVVLQSLVGNVSWLRIEDGGARMQAHLGLRNARLDVGSRFETVYEKIVATVVAQRVEGRGRLLCQVEAGSAGPELKLALSFEDYEVRRVGGKAPVVVGKNLALALRGPARAIGARVADWSAVVDVPTASVRDLTYLNQFVPRGLGLAVRSGSGQVRAKLEVEAERSAVARGFVNVSGKGVGLAYGAVSLRGDVVADVKLKRADLTARSFDVGGSKVAFTNVLTIVPDSDGVAQPESGWWGEVSTPEGVLVLEEPVSFVGRIVAKGRDLRPAIAIYGAISGLPDWVRDNVALKALSAEGRLRVDERTMHVPSATLTAEDLDVEAWFQRIGERPLGRMRVKYKAFTVGLGVDGDETEVKILNVGKWFGDKPAALR